MKKTFQALPLSALIVSATLLTACGGGGGSNTASPTNLGGVAAKGILKSALVTAEELVGTAWTPRGTATTATDGSYNISMTGYTNGPVRVTVTPTSSTKMICDAPSGCTNADGTLTAFGGDATLPSTFTMKAIVPPVTATEAVAYVTPLSDMVAANLEQNNASITSDTIKTVSSQISVSMGVPDILKTKPLDPTQNNTAADANGQRLAATLASVSEMLYQAKGSTTASTPSATDFTSAMSKLRDSFKDGKFDDTDTIQKADGTVSSFLQSVVDTKTAVINNNVISSKISTNVKTEVQTEVAEKTTAINASSTGEYKPPVVDTALLSDTDKAKAIVAQARALGTSLTSMESPAKAFGTQLETVNKVWDDRSSLMGLYLGEIIQDVSSQLGSSITTAVTDKQITLDSTQTYSCYSDQDGTLKFLKGITSNSPTVESGTCNVYPNYSSTPRKMPTVKVSASDSEQGLLLIVKKALPKTGDIAYDIFPETNLTFTIPNFTIADLTAKTKTLSGATILVNGTIKDTRATMTFNNLTAAMTFAKSYTATEGNTEEPTLSVASLKGGISLSDSVSGGSFTGNAEIQMVHPSTTSAKPMDLNISKIALDGTFAHGSNSVKASATLNLTNAASFDLAAFNQYQSQKNITLIPTDTDVENVISYIGTNTALYSLSFSSYDNQTCFYTSNGLACVTGDVLGFNSRVQQETGVSNSYAQYVNCSSNCNASVKFPDSETANNFVQGNLTLSLDANLAGFPNTNATVTVERSGFPDIGSATISLKQESANRGITISAANTVANNANAIDHITISSLDGTTMNVYKTGSGVYGTIKNAAGGVIGTISDQGSWTKIAYMDGTFDSLNGFVTVSSSSPSTTTVTTAQ